MADNLFQGVWNKATSWFVQNADKYIYVAIPKERTDTTDPTEALLPLKGYFRLWVSEMFLTRSVAWGIERFPAVQSEVQLQFGNESAITLSRVLRPSQGQGLSRGVRLNYRMTELLPYNGGVVEIEAALLDLQGSDYLGTALKVLQEFSSLVTVPIGQVLNIAAKVSQGTRDLLNASGGNVHLGFHETFTSSGGGKQGIIPGYIAVILATHAQVDDSKLSVQKDQLFYAPKGSREPAPLQGYDYMLLRIEVRKERDDWRLLKNITAPFDEAKSAWIQGDNAKADALKTIAIAAAWQSPDLTPADRTRVVLALREEWKEMQNIGLGAVGDVPRDLNAIMDSRAISVEQAVALGELSAEQVFAEEELS